MLHPRRNVYERLYKEWRNSMLFLHHRWADVRMKKIQAHGMTLQAKHDHAKGA